MLALTGCQMINRHTEETSGRTAGRTLDDATITSAVKDKLKDEPVYKFNDVNVNTFAGVVQLSGFVNTDGQKRRAGELAQQVDGVSQVENNISLKPSGNLQPTGNQNYNYNNEPQNQPANQPR
jgi:hyperosmotically inducible periplasmic protein